MILQYLVASLSCKLIPCSRKWYLRYPLTLFMLGIMSVLSVLSSIDLFLSKLTFGKINLGIPPVSNSLDPDQARRFVGPDLGSICLQRVITR